MILVVPSAVITLMYFMFHDVPDRPGAPSPFNTACLILLGLFPLFVMFLITSITMQRERASGTLERILTEQTNYEVRTASSGFAAGVECERFRPSVLLLDIHLGDNADARALSDSIRKNENLSDTKIVAMSGKLTDGQAANLRNQGYDGFLKKPFQVRQVVEAIEASLNLVR